VWQWRANLNCQPPFNNFWRSNFTNRWLPLNWQYWICIWFATGVISLENLATWQIRQIATDSQQIFIILTVSVKDLRYRHKLHLLYCTLSNWKAQPLYITVGWANLSVVKHKTRKCFKTRSIVKWKFYNMWHMIPYFVYRSRGVTSNTIELMVLVMHGTGTKDPVRCVIRDVLWYAGA